MKPLTLSIITALAFVSLASFAAAADSGVKSSASVATEKASADTPLHFSLTVMPVRFGFKGGELTSPSSSLTSSDILNQASSGMTSSSGLKIDTGVAAGPISGGLTYLNGNSDHASTFSNWYADSPRSDLGLQPVFILPSEYLDKYTSLNSSSTTDQTVGLGIHGGYELTPNLQINGAFLVAKSEKLSKVDDLNVKTEQMNWRLDLGGAYKFKDNITYSINFGYLDSGDAFNKGSSQAWQTGNSAYVVKHQLNMSF